MFFKVKQDNKVATKVLYNVKGIDQSGHKDILGFYACESEWAHFQLGVLNDLKARWGEDILIACVDELKGFPEAINPIFRTPLELRNQLKSRQYDCKKLLTSYIFTPVIDPFYKIGNVR